MSRTRRVRCLVLALTIALGAGLLAATQKPVQQAEVLFESAKQKEVVEGKLQEAIQIYQRIVQDHPTNRGVAAKALLRMGQCYERLGQADARKAYERLVREFGDQAEAVAEARARLSALVVPPAAKKGGLSVRQVWIGDADLTGSPSSDGRLMATTDWYTGNIAVRDLTTGETRRVTTTGDIMRSTAFGFFAKYSPDNKQIAYAWFDRKDDLFELRVVAADGTGDRALCRRENAYFYPNSWTPDGRSILAVLDLAKAGAIVSRQIVLVSAESGAVRVLKSQSESDPSSISVSPDGRFIVYDVPQADLVPTPGPRPPFRQDIALMSLQDGRETKLVEHPADDSSPIWTPDGRRVLFVSDRTGSAGLWAVEVADGKVVAPAELVRPDMKVRPLGFAASGTLFYGLSSDISEVYMATLDLQAGRLLDRPAPVSQRIVARRTRASWSPDGKFLAYVSATDPAPPGMTITLRALETGEERDVHVEGQVIRQLGWFPDGTALVVPGLDANRKPSVFRVDVKSGAISTIVQREAQAFRDAKVTHDGKTLVYLSYANDGKMLGVRDLRSGQDKIIMKSGYWPESMGLSPDGQQVAVTASTGVEMDAPQVLVVVPVSGGEPRELQRIEKPRSFLSFVAWIPDGTHILCGIRQSGAGPQAKTEYLLVPVAGGEPKKIALPMSGITQFSFHPDGRRVAFDAGRSSSEVWAIENFLPAPKR